MGTQELASTYEAIGMRLEGTEQHALGMDYCYVARLIRGERDIPHLVGELRRNLNRSRQYYNSERRNRALHVMAKTLERIEQA